MHCAPITPDLNEGASAEDLLALAEAYHDAALALKREVTGKGATAWAPCRFLAIHAVELYLSTSLRKAGYDWKEIRNGMKHSLGARLDKTSLNLRKRTLEHFAELDAQRAYLSERYIRPLAPVEPITRLEASLTDLRKKVRQQVAPTALLQE